MTNIRAVAGVVITVPEPAISEGRPSLPQHWAKFPATATLIQGPLHIHAIKDPNPVWNPYTGGWYTKPPEIKKPNASGAGDIRWSVDTLPEPANFPGDWYWLGDPTSLDGTANITSGARQWAADAHRAGPSWRSFFPFKPSVSAHDAYIPGEQWIHHAKGVHCDSHYIEHMWMDFGASQLQPFTWIVVATVMSNLYSNYSHTILDAGRNPDSVGFPRLSAGATATERRIGDNLPYRTWLSVTDNSATILTHTGDGGLRTRRVPGHHPVMFASIFDGRTSRMGVYDPYGRNLSSGSVRSGGPYTHRYMVFGRQQGWMSQAHASNILIFEMRYWHHALTPDDLAGQYAQLSSTHQFDKYKRL